MTITIKNNEELVKYWTQVLTTIQSKYKRCQVA
jgi:hypothetical protein